MKVKSDYLNKVFKPDKFAEILDETIKAILAFKPKFDAIAFTGVSGAAMAFPVSAATGIPLICIRKSKDNTHYFKGKNPKYEGITGIKKYIILDDFVTSGETIRTIKWEIKTENPKAKCVGIYTYLNIYKYKWENIKDRSFRI